MVASRRRNTLLTRWTPLVCRARRVEAATQAFKQSSPCRFRWESSLKEELCYPVSSVIRRSRSSQLISSEGLKGYSRGGPGEEVCRELFECIWQCKACRVGTQVRERCSHCQEGRARGTVTCRRWAQLCRPAGSSAGVQDLNEHTGYRQGGM